MTAKRGIFIRLSDVTDVLSGDGGRKTPRR